MRAAWIELLNQECDASTQKAVGVRIGYSSAAICQVLKGTYKGDLTAVETAVKKKLMQSSVTCPIWGEISPAQCSTQQSKPFSAASSISVQLFKACRNCPNNTKRREK